MCDSKELLVAFLYDELDPSAKRNFQTHLATCSECRDEVAELRATRGRIAMWSPPEADLGFQIVRRAETTPSRFRLAPAWALAAAAVLVLAAGAALANFDVRYGSDGLVVRTGWQHAPDPQTAARDAGSSVTPVDWKAQAEALDRRVRDLERATAQTGSPVRDASASAMSDEEVLQRVREMLAQSEARQQRLLAARAAEMTRDFDARRRVDLAAIDQGLARLQNTNGAEMKEYRDLLQRMYRVTSYQQK